MIHSGSDTYMSNLLHDHTTGKPTGDQNSSEDGGSDSDNDDSKNNLNKESDFIPTHFNHDNLLPKPPTQPQPTQKWVKTYCEERFDTVLERTGPPPLVIVHVAPPPPSSRSPRHLPS